MKPDEGTYKKYEQAEVKIYGDIGKDGYRSGGLISEFQNLAYEQRAIDIMRQHGYDIDFLDTNDLTQMRKLGEISPHLDLGKNPESFVRAPVYDAASRKEYPGRVLDVHTPRTVGSAWSTALDKVSEGQADGVIINLARKDKNGKPEVTFSDLFDKRGMEEYTNFIGDLRATHLRELWIVDEAGDLHAVPLNLLSPEEIRQFRVDGGLLESAD